MKDAAMTSRAVESGRAARDGANLGDAWFDRIELKRIAACEERPGLSRPWRRR